MKTDVSRQAAATLAAVNAVLDGDVPHWSDPEFLEWERGQVSDPVVMPFEHPFAAVAVPGPGHCRYGVDVGVHRAPMVRFVDDHSHMCGECTGGPPLHVARAVMSTRAADYPPPAETTHGPLLLGPEPPTVVSLCLSCLGLGEAIGSGDCDACNGFGWHQAVAR